MDIRPKTDNTSNNTTRNQKIRRQDAIEDVRKDKGLKKQTAMDLEQEVQDSLHPHKAPSHIDQLIDRSL